MTDWYQPRQCLRGSQFDKLEEQLEDKLENNLKHVQHPCKGSTFPQEITRATEPPVEPIQTRSTKLKGKNHDISFQDCFMEEHQKAFKKQTSNFIESCFKQIQQDNLSFKIFDSIQWQSPSAQLLDQKQKKQFNKDKETQQKLASFQKLIQELVPPQVIPELNYLMFLGWQNYLRIRDQQYDRNMLIDSAENFASKDYQKIFEQSGIKFLNLKVFEQSQIKSRQSVKKSFQRFLRFFYVTIFLLVQEYFQNPYHQQQQAKRQRSFVSLFQGGDDFSLDDPFSSSDDSNNYLNQPYKRKH